MLNLWPNMTSQLMRDAARLHRQIENASRRVGPGSLAFNEFPPMAMQVGPEDAVVTVELPGMKPDDVEVEVKADVLSISGKRVAEELPENARFLRRERSHGEFVRKVRLPFPVDPDKVDATYSNGLLEVKLPRAESDRPKRITIKS
jgi:HSP20 family protein